MSPKSTFKFIGELIKYQMRADVAWNHFLSQRASKNNFLNPTRNQREN